MSEDGREMFACVLFAALPKERISSVLEVLPIETLERLYNKLLEEEGNSPQSTDLIRAYPVSFEIDYYLSG